MAWCNNDINKEFWENAHKEDRPYWLSNSSFVQIWEALNIMNKLAPGLKILDIGVGTGRETEELLQYQSDVIIDALDISQAAVDKVKNITRNQYISSNIENLPSNEYDIAFSYMVTEMMETDELEKQIKYVIRSLKPDGIFVMQVTSINPNKRYSEEELNELYPTKISYPRFRTLFEMEGITKKYGGEITWASEIQTVLENPIEWYYLHIKKNKIT